MHNCTRLKSTRLTFLFALFAVAGGAAPALAQTWPGTWIPLSKNNVALIDPLGDQQNERDIVGDMNNPSIYVQRDATYFYFRMRVGATALQNNGEFKPFGWGCEMDTNNDLMNYEFIAMLDGINNPDQVLFAKNTVQTQVNNPNDTAEMDLATYPIPTFARQVNATSMFGGDPDFFVDWAIRVSDMVAAGITDTTPLRFICGTSNNARALAADVISASGATTLTDLGSDPVLCNSSGCIACNSNQACGAMCIVCSGTTPICDMTGMGACVGCLNNTHCSGTTPICNTTIKKCVTCLNNSQCSGTTPVCNVMTGVCVGCTADANCGGTTPACQPGGACGQCSATNKTQCTGLTPMCNTMSGMCVGCTTDAACGGTTPACQPTGACGQCSATNKTACTGNTPVCNTTTGVCVPCTSDNQCGGTTPACQPNGSCGQCSSTNTTQCMGNTPTCNTNTGTCVAGCMSDNDCSGMTPACQPTKICGQCSATNKTQCTGATPVCDVTKGMCVGCKSDADCGGTTPACQPSGACGQCSATNSTECKGNTPVCNVMAGVCAPCGIAGDGGSAGCSGNPDGTVCQMTGMGGGVFCGCNTDADCGGPTSGRICNGMTKKCEPGCSPATGRNNCPMGQFCTSDDLTGMKTGVCTTTCNFDKDCAPMMSMPLCLIGGDAGMNMCVQCRSNTDCANQTTKKVCDLGNHTCVECTTGMTSACTGDKPVCTMMGTCGCTTNMDCGTNRVCNTMTRTCMAAPADMTMMPPADMAVTPSPDMTTGSGFTGGGLACSVRDVARGGGAAAAWMLAAALVLIGAGRLRRRH